MSSLLFKLLLVMWHDRKTGPFRIVAKSYARYRRFGYKDMKRKLEREYFALYPNTSQQRDAQRRYRQWRRRHEKNVGRGSIPLNGPRFAIVVHLEETPLHYLRTMLQSVRQQSYGLWELWMFVPENTSQKITNFLTRKAKEDPRIKIVSHEEAQKDRSLDETMKECSSSHVLTLGPSDRLAPHALSEFAKIVRRKPQLKLLYSDEDRIDEKGRRYAPYFKSGWNPDLFLSCNYIGALWCLKKEAFLQAGGLNHASWEEGRYALLLRATRQCAEQEIHHCSKILYHRRVPADDRRILPSPLTSEEACRAVAAVLNEEQSVRPGLIPGSCKVEYPLPDPTPLVSILVPTRDGYDLLYRCIESVLKKTRYPHYEIIIIDNQSEDTKTLEYMKRMETECSHISVLRYEKPFNYSAINNFAAAHAAGEVLVLLNNDVEVISEYWLTEMVQHAIRPEIGAVGAMLYYDNLTVQHAGVVLGLGEVAGHAHKYFPRESTGYFGRLKTIQNYSAVTAACLAVRKELFFEVGGLDEVGLSVAFNDVDFCLKLRERGYRNLWTPYAELYHHESKSRGVDDTPQKRKRFESEVVTMQERWGKGLEQDPYYNRNLSRFFEDFRIETYWEQRRRLQRKKCDTKA